MPDEDLITEYLFDIPIFQWESFDQGDEQTFIFHNVIFLLEDCKQFDGCSIEVDFGYNTVVILDSNNEHEYILHIARSSDFITKLGKLMETKDMQPLVTQRPTEHIVIGNPKPTTACNAETDRTYYIRGR